MENQKVQMTRRQFRIGDLAKELKVKKFVIRFWEKEFKLKSDRSQGGQRFYTSDDLNVFLTIKDLLYNQGFTIAGAKKQLPEILAGAKLAPDSSFQEINNAQESFSCAVQESDAIDDKSDDNECEEQESEESVRDLSPCEPQVCEVVKEEVCVPARVIQDTSFYEGLATLKDQLMRLYELLD